MFSPSRAVVFEMSGWDASGRGGPFVHVEYHRQRWAARDIRFVSGGKAAGDTTETGWSQDFALK
jgi:hypothetical protein